MRAYLSSYKWGDQPERLFEMVTGQRAAIIMNAADLHDTALRAEKYNDDAIYLKARGFTVEELDLRDYFNDAAALEQKLHELDLLWVRGGEVFVLRRAMQQSGFDQIILNALSKNSLVYAGYSAGACVMGNSLHGLEKVDDPSTVPDGYNKAVVWEGLNIVDAVIIPHYKSDHPESPAVDESVAYCKAQNIPYVTIRDGEAIILNT